MKRNSDIEKELREISPAISGIKNNTVFEVPPGYFEGLPERLLRLVKEHTANTDLMPGEEIKALSPLIASLKNKPVFNVPAGYFDALPQTLTEKVAGVKKEAPVFRINSGFKNRKPVWLKYAAAAVVTGVIATSVLFFRNTTTDEHSNPAMLFTENDSQKPVIMELPQVSDADLASYLSAVPETLELILEEDTDTEFADFVFFKMDDSNLGDMLKDVPYEALLNYEEDISGKEVSL
ncbi:hypothetical protein [Agriterribacter sp.]|uniref:hypothetical protein n=1 Tax=Agriterribacter sp. TaxID=2821509 RepID=UPI002BEBAB28|nr:hypothetical protein [Agriterribacter sp.]HRP54692.1 hypothetical protein [Agriterribacter sp.]